MRSLGSDTKRALCQALECQGGSWESLANTLGLGILNSAFRLSPSPASTLLDSYEVHTHYPNLRELKVSLGTYSSFSLVLCQDTLINIQTKT